MVKGWQIERCSRYVSVLKRIPDDRRRCGAERPESWTWSAWSTWGRQGPTWWTSVDSQPLHEPRNTILQRWGWNCHIHIHTRCHKYLSTLFFNCTQDEVFTVVVQHLMKDTLSSSHQHMLLLQGERVTSWWRHEHWIAELPSQIGSPNFQ